ncbi:MAG: DUF917 domain-containing protein [Pseudomonadota bacterium]
MRSLERQDLTDILYGAAIYGAGGGGSLEEGFGLIDDAMAAGRSFDLVSLDEAPDDALVCTPYMLGAVSPAATDEDGAYGRLPRIDRPAILIAYERFQTYLGRRFFGTIACELGGSNTAVAFYAAAMSGHAIIDADPAGRAVPEITHSTYYIAGLPAAPIVMANEFGETIICENVADDLRAETLVRALSIVSRNDIAAIDHALEVRQIRGAIIPGTISIAQAMGKAWRLAWSRAKDVAATVAETGGGIVAFCGQVTDAHSTIDGAFTVGETMMTGTGTFEGRSYRIWLKNENLAGWLDGAVHATPPDLICVLDTETGHPVVNPDCRPGQSVAVVILPAPEIFTTPKGLSAFGPAYAGFDTPYVPAVTGRTAAVT